MPEPALRCLNNAIFKQNYNLELLIALKMAYSCCLGLRGNLDFPYFFQKKFYNINYRTSFSQSGITIREINQLTLPTTIK